VTLGDAIWSVAVEEVGVVDRREDFLLLKSVPESFSDSSCRLGISLIPKDEGEIQNPAILKTK